MKYILLVIFVFFSGCSSKICGINEKAFMSMDKSSQEKICINYQNQQIEKEKTKREKILYQKKLINSSPKQLIYIEGFIFHKGKYKRIIPSNYSFARNEVRKVCFRFEDGDGTCFWVGFTGTHIIWNIDPDHDYYYIDKNLSRVYIDSQMNKTSVRSHKVKLKGKYRGLEGILKFKVRRNYDYY